MNKKNPLKALEKAAPFSSMDERYIEEAISFCHVLAICSMAGFGISTARFDYGVDGTFQRPGLWVKKIRYNGYGIDFQLKASYQNWRRGADGFKFRIDTDVYNELIDRNEDGSNNPMFLIVCPLHKEKKWVTPSIKNLLLEESCYWKYVVGKTQKTPNSTYMMDFADSDLFTPDALTKVMDDVEGGKFLYGAR